MNINIKFKNIIILLIICSIAYFAVGCTKEDNVQNTIDNMFTTIKSGDYENLSNYFVDSNNLTAATLTNVNGQDITKFSNEYKEEITYLMKKSTEKLTYTINEIKKDETSDIERYVVNLNITNKNYTDILKKFIKEAVITTVKTAISKDDTTDNVTNNLITNFQKVLDNKTEMITYNIDIEVIKENEDYKIVANTELINAITGNMLKTILEWSDSLSNISNIGNLINFK